MTHLKGFKGLETSRRRSLSLAISSPRERGSFDSFESWFFVVSSVDDGRNDALTKLTAALALNVRRRLRHQSEWPSVNAASKGEEGTAAP
jgi:hypothetical protein